MTLNVELGNYNLPDTYKRNGKACFLDPVREKFILKTPEEKIRQKTIQFLQQKMKVPKEMIAAEVPISYYEKGASGRADIIVSVENDQHELIPILIVECKAPTVPLTDDVFEQVDRYNKIVEAETVIITNGKKFRISSLASQSNQYRELRQLPTYKKLVTRNNMNFVEQKENVWQRPNFRNYDQPEVYGEFMTYGALGVETKEELVPFIINLMGLFLEETNSLQPQALAGINIVKDGGLRYTSFSDASGGRRTGLYRYFIIEDEENNNQIISMSIYSNNGTNNDLRYGTRKAKSILEIAIDDFEKSHTSLGLNLNRFTSKKTAHSLCFIMER